MIIRDVQYINPECRSVRAWVHHFTFEALLPHVCSETHAYELLTSVFRRVLFQSEQSVDARGDAVWIYDADEYNVFSSVWVLM